MNGQEQLANYWDHRAKSWHKINPPLSPSPRDLEVYRKLLPSVGPGLVFGATAMLCGALSSAVKYCVDISPEMLRMRAHGVQHLVADWNRVPIADSSIRWITIDGGLNVMPYPRQSGVFEEAYRLLADNGALVARVFDPECVGDTPFKSVLHLMDKEYNVLVEQWMEEYNRTVGADVDLIEQAVGIVYSFPPLAGLICCAYRAGFTYPPEITINDTFPIIKWIK